MSEAERIPIREQTKTALEGLRRIAFGPVNDAVRLAARVRDLDAEELAALDLFPVAELKQKDGCCEIKFFDRLKALELLLQHSREHEAQPAAGSFYTALESAAKSACDADAV